MSFFDTLPAELRIQIYHNLIEPALKPILWSDPGAYFKTLAVKPSALLTSRQMKEEAEAELALVKSKHVAETPIIACYISQLNHKYETIDGPLRVVMKVLERAASLDAQMHNPNTADMAKAIDKVLLEFGDVQVALGGSGVPFGE